MPARQCGSTPFHVLAISPDFMNGLLERAPPSISGAMGEGESSALTTTLTVCRRPGVRKRNACIVSVDASNRRDQPIDRHVALAATAGNPSRIFPVELRPDPRRSFGGMRDASHLMLVCKEPWRNFRIAFYRRPCSLLLDKSRSRKHTKTRMGFGGENWRSSHSSPLISGSRGGESVGI